MFGEIFNNDMCGLLRINFFLGSNYDVNRARNKNDNVYFTLCKITPESKTFFAKPFFLQKNRMLFAIFCIP